MGVGVSSVESSGFVPLCICLWLLMGQCTSRRAGQLCVCETVGVGVTMCESLWVLSVYLCDCVCVSLVIRWRYGSL